MKGLVEQPNGEVRQQERAIRIDDCSSEDQAGGGCGGYFAHDLKAIIENRKARRPKAPPDMVRVEWAQVRQEGVWLWLGRCPRFVRNGVEVGVLEAVLRKARMVTRGAAVPLRTTGGGARLWLLASGGSRMEEPPWLWHSRGDRPPPPLSAGSGRAADRAENVAAWPARHSAGAPATRLC